MKLVLLTMKGEKEVKMAKRVKSFVAIFLSLTMIMMMGAAVFAATPPSTADRSTITVTNVEGEGVTVTAYRIAEPEYNSNGLTGYKVIDELTGQTTPLTIADLENPTEAEISAIANYFVGKTEGRIALNNTTADPTTYSAEVGAGMYVALVTGSNTRVYNPMVLSAGYTDANDKDSLGTGSVDATSKFAGNAYAKSKEITVGKKILSDSTTKADGNTAGYGSTVNFEIESTIPSYSDSYTHVTFFVEDTLSAGLTMPAAKDIAVYLGGTNDSNKVVSGDDTYSVSISGQKMTVTFAENFIKTKTNQLKQVYVRYSATVNEKAAVNYDPNTNTATVNYTNKPKLDADGVKNPNNQGKTTDKTNTYTFGIDANLGGNDASGKPNGPTSEVKKEKVITEEGGQTLDTPKNVPAADAEFTLYSDKDCTTPVTIVDAAGKVKTNGTAVSDANGALTMKGLAPGTYYLKETKAPQGYMLEAGEHKVVISAKLTDKGLLDTYTITIDDKVTNTYKATFDNDGNMTVGLDPNVDPNGGTLTIVNNKIPALPSTGGIGTYILYLIGTIIMIVGAVMFIKKRKAAASK